MILMMFLEQLLVVNTLKDLKEKLEAQESKVANVSFQNSLINSRKKIKLSSRTTKNKRSVKKIEQQQQTLKQ